MRNASGAMQSFLLSQLPYFKADLFTITLTNGTVFRWTTFSGDVTYSGQTWVAYGPAIKRSNWNVKNTSEVPQMEFWVYSNGEDVYGFNQFKLAVHDGLLDGAIILLQRAIMPTPGDTSLGLIDLFLGRCGSIHITALGINITANGLNSILEQYMPRNEYQTDCILVLYSPTCTLNAATYTTTDVVGTGTITSTHIPWASIPGVPDYFQLGVLVITSGPGEGQRRTIDSADSTGMYLSYPLYTLPNVGDGITYQQGCTKTQARCNQFGNIQNRRGFDYIPVAEAAY